MEDRFEMEDLIFLQNFRLIKTVVLDLCEEVKPYMNVPSNSYAVEMQVFFVVVVYLYIY